MSTLTVDQEEAIYRSAIDAGTEAHLREAQQPETQGAPTAHRWENVDTGRYYEVRIVQDLFGDWQLMRVWGGIGNARGALRFDVLAEPAAFCDDLVRIDKRRQQRGYVLRP